MIGKIFIGMLAIFLLLGAFSSPISNGIKGWRTNDTTESYAISTGSGETTENVTLSYELFQASTAEVIAITSNESGDSPVATSYDEDTQVMLISGLASSKTHTITVNYLAETDDTVMRVIGPFLGFLIIGGIIFLILWSLSKKGQRG